MKPQSKINHQQTAIPHPHSKALRLLAVEDSPRDMEIALHEIRRGGFDVTWKQVETAEAMGAALREETWDIILCDYNLPLFNGPDAIALLKATGMDIPLIIVSGAIGEETAVECMRLGAHDYIMKGNLSRLVPAIERELQEAESRIKRRQAESQREAALDDLKASEEKYRSILETMQEGYFEVDFAGNLLFFNDSLCRFFGYSKAELTGMNNRQYTDKENAKKLLETFNKVYSTGEPTEGFDWQVIRKDGAKRYVEASISLRKDSSGKPIGFRGIVRDVTDRKQAESQREDAIEALQKSEANYKQLFDNAPSAIYQIDFRTGKFLKANDVICKYFCCSQEEITSISPYDLLAKESQMLFLERLHKMSKGDKVPANPEFEFVDKKGKSRWLKLNSKYIYDSEGLAGADVIAHDITERRMAEAKLRESEEKYRLLVENANEMILVAQDGKLKFTNRMGELILRRSEEEIMAAPFVNFIHPDDRDMVMEYHRKRLEGQVMPDFYSFRIMDGEGNAKWVEISAILISWEGRPATLNFFKDITERKQTAEELQKTMESLRKAFSTTVQVMASAVEVKDPYTAGHQFRVADLARVIATEMGLSPEIIEGIRMAGTIHDIGKLSVPAEILTKPTKLSDAEFTIIKEHSQTGYDMLKDVDSPWPLAQIVYQHHERMNGSGYPRKLKGDEILIEARIMAVADVVEAMASYRPYRPALGIDVALAEIEKNRETLYDATVADVCLKLFREKGYKIT